MSILIEKLNKSYKAGEVKKKILKDISLKISDGEFISIMGPSGSGKSTLIKCISTLEDFDSGTVILGDHEIATLDEKEISDFRGNKLGFVFQDHNILDVLTVEENVSIPLILNKENKNSIKTEVDKWLDQFQIKDIAKKYPSQISGGESQRTAIARAFIKKPKYIFADEPTGSLDSVNSKKLMQILTQLNRNNTTIIMVTHDPLVASYANRVLFLRDGEIYKELTKKKAGINFYSTILSVMDSIGEK